MEVQNSRPFTADRVHNPRVHKNQQQVQPQQQQNVPYQQPQMAAVQYDDQQNVYGDQNNDMFFQQYESGYGFQQRSGSAQAIKPGKALGGLSRPDSKQQKAGFRAQTAQPQNRMIPYSIGNKYQGPLQQKADYFKKNQEMFDKEQLFEDLQHSKGIINQLKEENSHLKTRNLNMEREINKQQKLMEELQHAGQQGNKRSTKLSNDTFLITSLKRQIKEYQQEVSFKTQEIDKLKKNIKYTKFSEIEIEKKAFADETIRLRRISEQLLEENRQHESQEEKNQQLEERCFLLNNLVETLRKDNTDMANAIRILEEKAYSDQQQNASKNKQFQEQKKIILQQKKLIAEKDEQLKSLRRNYQGGPSPDKKNGQQNKLERELQEKNDKIQDLEKKVKQFQTEKRGKLDHKQRERPDLVTANQKPRVQLEDISYYLQYIKIILQLNDFNIQELSQHIQHNLPEDAVKYNRASINHLKEYFKKEPFNLQNSNELDLLCRYITEGDSHEQHVLYDPNRFCNLSIIKSKLTRNLDYKLMSNEEKNHSFDEISQLLKLKMDVIKQNLEESPSESKDYFSYSQIEPAFKNSQINLKPEQIDYILTKIINFNEQKNDINCLKNLKINDLYAAFSVSMDRPNRMKRPPSSKGRRTSESGIKPQQNVSPNQGLAKQSSIPKPAPKKDQLVSFQDGQQQQQKTDEEYGDDDDFYNYGEEKKDEQTEKQQQQKQQQQSSKEESNQYLEEGFESEKDNKNVVPQEKAKAKNDGEDYGEDFDDDYNDDDDDDLNIQEDDGDDDEEDNNGIYNDDFDEDDETNKKQSQKK